MIKSIQRLKCSVFFDHIPCWSNVPLHSLLQCFLCVLTLSLIGCKQDPFGDFSEEFRERLQELAHYVSEGSEEGVQEERQAISSQFVRILADDLWQVSAGREFQTHLHVKVFLEEDQFDDLSLEVLDFEGENYAITLLEQTSAYERVYLFKWTPSLGFLGDQLEKLTQVHFRLKVFGLQSLEGTQAFDVFIRRNFDSPEVHLVDMPSFLNEGDEGVMKVHVLDENATEEQPPVLIFNPYPHQRGNVPRDLNQLLSFVQKKKMENEEHIWEFEYRIRTKTIEDSGPDQVLYALNLSAYSSYSGLSEQQTVRLAVGQRVLAPTVVGPQVITAPVGQPLSIVLYILDSAGEGRFSSQVLNLEDIPGNVELYDEIEGADMTSTLIWHVPDDIDTSQTYEIKLEVANQGTQNSQGLENSVLHIIAIDLQNTQP